MTDTATTTAEPERMPLDDCPEGLDTCMTCFGYFSPDDMIDDECSECWESRKDKNQ